MTPHELIEALQHGANNESIEAAKAWLQDNPYDSHYEAVIESLMHARNDSATVGFILGLLERTPKNSSTVLALMLSHTADLRVISAIEGWLDDNPVDPASGWLIREYTQKLRTKEAAARGLKWLNSQPAHKIDSQIILALVEIDPSEECMAKAVDLINRYPDKIHSPGLLIAALLKCGQRKGIDIGRDYLIAISENDWQWTNNILTIHDMYSSASGSYLTPYAYDCLEQWLCNNSNRASLLPAVVLSLPVEPPAPPAAVKLAKKWLDLNPGADGIDNLVCALLNATRDQEFVEIVKEKLAETPDDINMLCCLIRSCQDVEGLNFAKKLLNNQSSDPETIELLNELHHFSHDDTVIGHVKKWVEANPTDEGIPGLLAKFLSRRFDEDLAKVARAYLDYNPQPDEFVWLIEALLRIKPDEYSRDRARRWLESIEEGKTEFVNASNEGRVIAALLESQADQFSIKKAYAWLDENEEEEKKVAARIRDLINQLRKEGKDIVVD